MRQPSLILFTLFGLFLAVAEVGAQTLSDQVIRGGSPAVLDPLQDFDPEATLSLPSVPATQGEAVVTEDGRYLVFFPAENVGGAVPISVEVNSGGETVRQTFIVAVDRPVAFTEEQLEVIGAQLLLLLVVSIFLETALSVLFGWRVFQLHFDGRGWKTPIAVFASAIFVYGFDIDAMGEVLEAFELDAEFGWFSPTKIVSTLILAGGSSLIFRLFETFGLRAPVRRKEEIDELREKAGLKVKVSRGMVPQNREVLVAVDDIIVGQIAAGETLSHTMPLSRGFLVEPGLRRIRVSALAVEKVQATIEDGEARGDQNERSIYLKDSRGNVVTRDVAVSQETSHALAPRADVTISLAFPK